MKIEFTRPGAVPVEFKAIEHFQVIGNAFKIFGVAVNEAAAAAGQWTNIAFKMRWNRRRRGWYAVKPVKPMSRKQRLRRRELHRRWQARGIVGKTGRLVLDEI